MSGLTQPDLRSFSGVLSGQRVAGTQRALGLTLVWLLAACTHPPPIRSEYQSRVQTAPLDVEKLCGEIPKIPPLVAADPAFTLATLTVEFKLLASNEVSNIRITRTSGYPALDEAAIRAVSKWRCNLPDITVRPATLAIPFTFRPEK